MLCNSNVGLVQAVSKKHPGKFNVDERPAKDHADELKALGIESHGVVCVLDSKTLWKKTDHKMSEAELNAGLEVALEALK